MKAILASVCGVTAMALTFLAQAGEPKGLDPAKVLGSWNYVSGTREGEKVPEAHLKGTVRFDKDKVIVPGEKGEEFVMSYKIDGSKSPAAIDLTIDKAPIKEAVGSKAFGIIAVDGDAMKLAYVEGNTRPKSFESTKENKVHAFVLKRAK